MEPAPDLERIDPLALVIAEEGRDGVIEVLSTLTPDERFVLYLKDAEGLSLNEIAAAIGKPLGSVKSKLSRTRVRFKSRYEEIIGDESK